VRGIIEGEGKFRWPFKGIGLLKRNKHKV